MVQFYTRGNYIIHRKKKCIIVINKYMQKYFDNKRKIVKYVEKSLE